MNVGASRPEDLGDFFAWGETDSKEFYTLENYKRCEGSYDSLTFSLGGTRGHSLEVSWLKIIE